jgi:predicted alpha/beta superfamily hydrolase
MPQIIWGGQTGCLLPLLIIFNLLFGRAIFNSTSLWLGVEAALVLIFIIKIHLFMHKIKQHFSSGGRGSASDSRSSYGKVVDVEGKVVEDNKKLN